MKPHKHAELIKAWADGANIEVYSPLSGGYHLIKLPDWSEFSLYRIKPEPEPKPDVVQFCRVKVDSNKYAVRLTFDGKTGKLKAAEVLK